MTILYNNLEAFVYHKIDMADFVIYFSKGQNYNLLYAEAFRK